MPKYTDGDSIVDVWDETLPPGIGSEARQLWRRVYEAAVGQERVIGLRQAPSPDIAADWAVDAYMERLGFKKVGDDA